MYEGHTGPMKALACSPDGQYIASAGNDTAILVQASSTGNLVCKYSAHTAWVRTLDWSPDSAHIASASDETVHVWRA
jgi:WD40 repeat protein